VAEKDRASGSKTASLNLLIGRDPYLCRSSRHRFAGQSRSLPRERIRLANSNFLSRTQARSAHRFAQCRKRIPNGNVSRHHRPRASFTRARQHRALRAHVRQGRCTQTLAPSCPSRVASACRDFEEKFRPSRSRNISTRALDKQSLEQSTIVRSVRLRYTVSLCFIIFIGARSETYPRDTPCDSDDSKSDRFKSRGRDLA